MVGEESDISFTRVVMMRELELVFLLFCNVCVADVHIYCDTVGDWFTVKSIFIKQIKGTDSVELRAWCETEEITGRNGGKTTITNTGNSLIYPQL